MNEGKCDTNTYFSSVNEVDELQVVSSSAYVLFYRRRDTHHMSSIPADHSTPSDQPVGESNTTSTAPVGDEVERSTSHMELD
jgi:hypothetical protein